MTIDKIAENVVNDIVSDIEDRSGLGNEWEQIDDGVKQEIIESWKDIVKLYIS